MKTPYRAPLGLCKSVTLFIATLLTSASAVADSKACPAGANKVALVVIDMQPFFAKRGGAGDDSENMQKLNLILNSQKEALAGAKKANIPIIVVEYEYDGIDKTNSELVGEMCIRDRCSTVHLKIQDRQYGRVRS